MSYTQELRDVELVLGEEEISRRIETVAEYSRRTEMFRYTSPPGEAGMTPDQFLAWAQLAKQFPDATMDGSAIYRLKTVAELRKDVISAEYNERTRYGQHHPAVCYEDLVAAGQNERAADLLEEYGNQARRDCQPEYVS